MLRLGYGRVMPSIYRNEDCFRRINIFIDFIRFESAIECGRTNMKMDELNSQRNITMKRVSSKP